MGGENLKGFVLDTDGFMRPIPSLTNEKPCRVVAASDAMIEQDLLDIIGHDPRYDVCGAAHTLEEASDLIRKYCPDVLLIEAFLENLHWIKDIATEFPGIRILVIFQESEPKWVELALQAGASGYWVKNGSGDGLMKALETVPTGEVSTSRPPALIPLSNLDYNSNRRRRYVAQSTKTRQLAHFLSSTLVSSFARILTKLDLARR